MEVGEWSANGEWTATPDLNRVYREIRALGIETNLAELLAFGFTVIPDALPKDKLETVRQAVVDITEKRVGRRLDIEHEMDFEVQGYADLDLQRNLLYKHPVFEEVVLNPKPLALVTFLLGYSCRLSALQAQIRPPKKTGLPLHIDGANGVLHSPLPNYPVVTNVMHVLTDFTRENGAIAMLPGSHLLGYSPGESERNIVGDHANLHAIPIETPAGSAIVWHPNTWHGGYPRETPGLRISLSAFYGRNYLEPFEDYTDIPDEVLARHGRDSRLAQIVGLNRWNAPGARRDRGRVGATWHA